MSHMTPPHLPTGRLAGLICLCEEAIDRRRHQGQCCAALERAVGVLYARYADSVLQRLGGNIIAMHQQCRAMPAGMTQDHS